MNCEDQKYCMHKKNKDRGCHRWLPSCNFKKCARGYSNMCVECIAKHRSCCTSFEALVHSSVKDANRRTRLRGGDKMLGVQAALLKWNGVCPICTVSLALNNECTDKGKAVIDRIDTSCLNYTNNFQWMCIRCNNLKKQRTFTAEFSVAKPELKWGAGHGRPTKALFVLCPS
jgi:hypothetical protein